MKRREFIMLLGARAAATSIVDASKRSLIGFLGTSPKVAGARYFERLAQDMSEFGYVAQMLAIMHYFAHTAPPCS